MYRHVLIFAALLSINAYVKADTTFPTIHPANAQPVVWSRLDKFFGAFFWQADGALWVEIVPPSPSVFICSSSFTVVQGGAQYRPKLEDKNGNSFCNDLFIRSIFKFAPYITGEPFFDPSHSLTVHYDGGYQIYSLDLGEAPWAAQNPQPTDSGPLVYTDKMTVTKATCKSGGKTVRAKPIDTATGTSGYSCGDLKPKPGRKVVITVTGRP
jgi:hypothetical protein